MLFLRLEMIETVNCDKNMGWREIMFDLMKFSVLSLHYWILYLPVCPGICFILVLAFKMWICPGARHQLCDGSLPKIPNFFCVCQFKGGDQVSGGFAIGKKGPWFQFSRYGWILASSTACNGGYKPLNWRLQP